MLACTVLSDVVRTLFTWNKRLPEIACSCDSISILKNGRSAFYTKTVAAFFSKKIEVYELCFFAYSRMAVENTELYAKRVVHAFTAISDAMLKPFS